MKGRVKIITDDPIIGNLLEVQLGDADFEAEYFNSEGLSVLYSSLRGPGTQAAEKEPMSVIIAEGSLLRADDFMRGNGFHRLLRTEPDTAGIPFVFLMSGTDVCSKPGGHAEGLQTGADAYVCKPFKTEDLLAQMEKVMLAARKARAFRTLNTFGDELSQMSLYDAVRIIELNCKSGELCLRQAPEKIRGKIFFDRGKIIAAETAHLQGEEAFFSLIGEDAGRLDFYGHDENSAAVSEQIKDSNMAILMRASRMSLESANLYYRIPNAEEVLNIVSANIPPQIEKDYGKEYMQKMLALIEKGEQVHEMISDTGMSSIRAGSLIVRLLDAGLVSLGAQPSSASPPLPTEFHPPEFISETLTDALRKARENKMTGVLKFGKNPQTKAAVYFEKGRLIHAWHGRVFGKKSLYRIFRDHSRQKSETRKQETKENRADTSHFSLLTSQFADASEFQNENYPVPVTVKEDLNFLFAEGDNEVAVLSRLRPASFEKTLALNPAADEQIGRLRGRQGLVYVLGLVQQYRTVKDILDASSMTDLATYKHLLWLFQKGMLIAAPEKKVGIRIVTDSGADLPPLMLREADITVIPLSVMTDRETWQEGSDMTDFNKNYEKFYGLMADADTRLRVFPPPEADFQKLFGKILADEDILGVFMSADMGKAFHHAAAARANIRTELIPRRNARLEMIDSRLISLGTGLLVTEACQKVRAGWSVEKIRAHILRIMPTVRFFAAADTPKYLPRQKQFGREGSLSRLRDILGVKPILTIQDGQLMTIDFVRGSENARRLLGELIRESLPDVRTPIKAGIMHSGAETEAALLRRFLEQEMNCKEIVSSHIGAALGSYCGPGAVGLAFFPTEK